MYKFTVKQRETQAQRLRNVDLRLVVGFLKTCLAFIAERPNGPLPMVVEGFRPPGRQAVLWAQGRTTPGPIVTNRRPGTSKHEQTPSKALDVGFLDDDGEPVYSEGNYALFNQLWQLHSKEYTWGGTWKDPKDSPHFEVS